ncbi:MAG: ABC transporter substrate-binding protein [Dokdonia sp.]|nr:ABC transporter substrate-binding protein [Dokdonia sp.]
MITLTDQIGQKLSFETVPQRIVSLVPSQTELLDHLRLRENIIGLTKFCVHPHGLKQEKTIVGGTKSVHFDRIAALKPDIILCNKEENTKEMVKSLRKIAPVHISDVRTLEDNYSLIEQYGLLFNREEEANNCNLQIQKEAAELATIVRGKPIIRVGYFIWKDPYMVAGSDTFIDEMLSYIGLENVFQENKGRYPEVQLETLKDMDANLLSSEPFPFAEQHRSTIENITGIPTRLVDGEYFSWYGSRMIKAFSYFGQLRQELELQKL